MGDVNRRQPAQAPTPEQVDGLWPALANPTFRSLWIGNMAMHLTIWMQSVAAAWLMVSLQASPLMVALIQTACALPSFFLALPSGVLADLVDRRRYLMGVVGFMIACAVLQCALSLGGMLSPWPLLFFTFCLGCGFALQGPAWFSAQTESVPRQLLPSALALSAVSYSSARALGPALAGAVVSAASVAAVFMINAMLLMVTMYAVGRWRSQRSDSKLPAEDLLSGLRSALRYVRHSEVMRAQILRTALFSGVASAPWALMPLIASGQLGSGAGSFGVLLGSIGVGSVVGALLLPRLKHLAEMNRMMGCCVLVYGAASVVTAYSASLYVVCGALFLAGVAWVSIGNTNMLALQSAVPAWIRARTVAIYMLVFQGGMALGSACWGAFAAHTSPSSALLCSAVLMLVVLAAMQRYPARMGEEAEVTDGGDALHGALAGASVPAGATVAIQIEYRVAEQDREEFLRQLYALGKVRQRDGASFWRLYRDLGRDSCYVERFIADSWDQYLRQRGRATQADRAAERRLWSLHAGPGAPAISHFVTERCP